MGMKTKLSLGALSVGVLLAVGLAYWTISENTQPIAPKGSAGALSRPQVSAPTAPPASTAAWPEVTNWPPGTHKPQDGLPENPPAEVFVHSANPTGFSVHAIGPF